jgi:hypothetical protein
MRAVALVVLALVVLNASARAHDAERTRVTLTFGEDGAFVLDVSNDPNWLLLRLESFAGGRVPPRITEADRDNRLRALSTVMSDRVVLWVDGREVRPESAEYLASDATFRLRGHLPLDARTLRWLYGAVSDPYPLIIRRADGRTLAELIEGSNWSGTFDLSGQFKTSRFAGVDHVVLLVLFFAAAVLFRVVTSVRSA